MGLFRRRKRDDTNQDFALTQSSATQDFTVLEKATPAAVDTPASTNGNGVHDNSAHENAVNGSGANGSAPRPSSPLVNPLRASAPPVAAAPIPVLPPHADAYAASPAAKSAAAAAPVSQLDPALQAAALRMIDGNAKAVPVISVRGLTKIYQMGDVEVAALRGVDLDIYPGEISAIMGPSGSGKSTLMNIIGCLDTPTSGSYLLDDVDVSRLSDDALATIRGTKIGFVFQSFNLLARTTAQDNVELPLIYLGTGGRERKRRGREVLQLVGLGDRMHHKPNELSGGQQQRVAIARALINEPAMILADEPTGNLDTKTSLEIMELFQRLNVEHGITIVFVTHNNETAEYCHRVIRVRDGSVESDIRHRPTAGIYSTLHAAVAHEAAPSIASGATTTTSTAAAPVATAGSKP